MAAYGSNGELIINGVGIGIDGMAKNGELVGLNEIGLQSMSLPLPAHISMMMGNKSRHHFGDILGNLDENLLFVERVVWLASLN